MRQIFYIFLFFIINSSLFGQIKSGEQLSGNIKATDIKGVEVDVFQLLDEGKTVVIDVFATWCGPCWSFHTSGYLKNLNELYGPEGTDQIRIIAIEGDGATPESQLYNSSFGDWTAGVKYHIINDHTFNSILKISFFPTLYVIRPNKKVMEMGDYRYDTEVWLKAMLPTEDIDLLVTRNIEDRTFCNTATFDQKPLVLNLGKKEINTMSIDFFRNGVNNPIETNKKIAELEEFSLGIPNIQQIKETTEIEVVVKSVDGVELTSDKQLKFKSTYLRPLVRDDVYIIKFTTDIYPGETSWTLRDNKQKIIINEKYKAGPGQFGAGGADANKTFEYLVELEDTDINCLVLAISDSAGDGLRSFNASINPQPGVEILKADGTIIKPKMIQDYNFTTARNVFTPFNLSSSAADSHLSHSVEIYPNPSMDILNISIDQSLALEYNVFVTDIMGRQVTQNTKNTNFIDVSPLQSGIYILNIQTDKGLVTKKFNKI